jgi:D-amino-acid dehydrogenase
MVHPMSQESKHVAVIGGGIIGLCAGYYLLKKGHRVTIVERAANHEETCAFGSAGMICPSHFIPLAAPGMVALGLKWMWNPESPFYIKPRLKRDLLSWGWKFMRAATARRVDQAAPALLDLNLRSRGLFLELEREIGDIGLVRRGLLMLCKTEHGLQEEAATAARARQLGLEANVLDANGVAALDPDIRMDICGGVHFPGDCHLQPARLLTALTSAISARGGELRWQAGVRGIETDSRRVRRVQTAAGPVEADEFVLCGGAWSPEIAAQLDVSLPMQAGKGYSLTVDAPPALARICSILCEARIAVTPMGGAMRFGGTMEMAGLNTEINPRRLRGIIRGATSYFPQFSEEHFRGIAPWRGLRPCSPDGLPYIGRFRQYDNLCAATGHAMLGLSLGPATGALLAEIVSGTAPAAPLDLFDPDRYL